MKPSNTVKLMRNKLVLLALIPLLVYWIACIAGLIQFHLWQQVVYMWELNLSLWEKLGYIHSLRFSLVLPIFLFSEWLGVSYDRLFSVIVPALLFTITYFSTRSLLRIEPELSAPRQALVVLGISLVLIGLSLLMNGRLMFAFTGSSILMWSLLSWEANHDGINFAAVASAIYLSCVSSGTFLILTFSFYFFLAVNVSLRNPAVCRRSVLLSYALLLVALNPLLSMFVFKNLEYYGGGFGAIFDMLSHGYGKLLLNSNRLLLIAGLALLLGLTYVFRDFIRQQWIMVSLVVIYLAGGLFGFSTALVVLPPLLVIASKMSLRLLDRWLVLRNGLIS